MRLKRTYVIGTLVMYYEIEMLEEYFQSIINMLQDVENKENVTVHLCFNMQEYLETLDREKISEMGISEKFLEAKKLLQKENIPVAFSVKDNNDSFYNIAQYRRDLNHNWCEKKDFVIWGETDSLFPAEGLAAIEQIADYAEQQGNHRYVVTFSYRKNWDTSWDVLTHEMFANVQYQENDDWMLNNEASSKSYMSIERMNEINSKMEELTVTQLSEPKFDGSCLVIASNLIKAGVNIPHALTHCAEDTSFGDLAKIIMGDKYVQYAIKNLLRVHNRRHPNKRNYIRGEDNPMGFAGSRKGEWWDILEKTSKYNLSILRNSQQKFISLDEVINKISNIRNQSKENE